MLPNFYDILGLLSTATDREILKAYRQKAKLYHPDLNKSFDAHQRFIEVNEAYEVLRDRTKRKLYDNIFLRQNATDFRENKTTEKGEQAIFAATATGRKKGEKYATNYHYFSKKVLKVAFATVLTELILSIVFGTLGGGLFTGIALFIGGIVFFFVNYDTELGLSISFGLFLTTVGALFLIHDWKQLTKELEE
jgi:hypothetical protein